MVQHLLPTCTLLELLTMVWIVIFYHRNFGKISNIRVAKTILAVKYRSVGISLKNQENRWNIVWRVINRWKNHAIISVSFSIISIDISDLLSIFQEISRFFWLVNSWSFFGQSTLGHACSWPHKALSNFPALHATNFMQKY